MKHIGILTSGGDAPGMNACIRAAVRASIGNNLKITGFLHGYKGLIDGDSIPLERREVANIVHTGGTVLGTARSEEFRTKEGRARAIKVIEEAGIEGLILIGGDGTFRGGTLLSEECGIAIVGIPGTIDNDCSGTDYTIGFDTAVNTALEAIDKIRDTAMSHDRLFFIEVMGRDTGFIALESGIGGGVEEYMIPEVPLPVEELCARLTADYGAGKRSAIVVVAEGDRPGESFRIAETVKQCSDYDSLGISSAAETPPRATVSWQANWASQQWKHWWTARPISWWVKWEEE